MERIKVKNFSLVKNFKEAEKEVKYQGFKDATLIITLNDHGHYVAIGFIADSSVTSRPFVHYDLNGKKLGSYSSLMSAEYAVEELMKRQEIYCYFGDITT